MSLIKFRRRPWGNLISSDFFDGDDFFENRLFDTKLFNNRFWNGRLREPALNVIETDDNFEIELAAPGFSKKDFEVTIDDGCLNISAEKSKTKKEEEDNYRRKEFSYTSFKRSLVLPESVKEEDIKAKYKDGILSFNLTKKEEAKKQKPKLIEIA